MVKFIDLLNLIWVLYASIIISNCQLFLKTVAKRNVSSRPKAICEVSESIRAAAPNGDKVL